jgi:hypothetical protein
MGTDGMSFSLNPATSSPTPSRPSWMPSGTTATSPSLVATRTCQAPSWSWPAQPPIPHGLRWHHSGRLRPRHRPASPRYRFRLLVLRRVRVWQVHRGIGFGRCLDDGGTHLDPTAAAVAGHGGHWHTASPGRPPQAKLSLPGIVRVVVRAAA